MSVEGRVFLYGSHNLCGLEVLLDGVIHQPAKASKVVVFIGGLSDGLLTPKCKWN
jgi:hypothetical protein